VPRQPPLRSLAVETSELDYDLPDDRIAQVPLEPRDSARLLVDRSGGVEHRHVRDLPDLLDAGDVVVVNTTRVLPARLHLVKETGGRAEVLLLEERSDLGEGCWEALVRPGRRLPPGTRLTPVAGAVDLAVVVGRDLGDGRRQVAVTTTGGDARAAIREAGAVPLPPYITVPLADAERYQTTYSDHQRDDSVAAPTAGLHLTPSLLSTLRDRGVETASVELVVGLGTFRPIATDKVEDHAMHRERFRVPEETVSACRAARARGNQVVAVGTTTVRALESVMASGELEGRTELFIRDPYEFQLVDRLLTNFHLPRSSLLVMIEAFAGPRWRDLYALAIAERYRFLSFGDAMLISRRR